MNWKLNLLRILKVFGEETGSIRDAAWQRCGMSYVEIVKYIFSRKMGE